MKCHFCSASASPTVKEVISPFGVLQRTETRPPGWTTIDRKVWCGRCDPRLKAKK